MLERLATAVTRRCLLGSAAVVAGLGLMLATGPAAVAQQSTPTISATILQTATALPLVVADKKGLFSKHGVSVKWTTSQVQISDSIAALGRQFDIVMGTQPSVIAASGQGLSVAVITGGALDTVDVPNANIVARSDSGITSFKQLQGKTVGTLTLTGNIHFALLNILQKEGVDLQSIRWVSGTVPTLPDILKAKRVDAIEEIEPFATSAIEAGGTALGDPFRSIGDRAYVGLFMSERSWANKNKDAILRFNTALSEAADWIHANEAESREILSSYTGLKGPVLAKTPIPQFHFSTTAEDLRKELRPDLQTWIDILRRTSDFPQVALDDLLPEWAK